MVIRIALIALIVFVKMISMCILDSAQVDVLLSSYVETEKELGDDQYVMVYRAELYALHQEYHPSIVVLPGWLSRRYGGHYNPVWNAVVLFDHSDIRAWDINYVAEIAHAVQVRRDGLSYTLYRVWYSVYRSMVIPMLRGQPPDYRTEYGRVGSLEWEAHHKLERVLYARLRSGLYSTQIGLLQ